MTQAVVYSLPWHAGNNYSWRLKPQANVTKYKYVLYGCNSFLQAWKVGC